MASFIARTPENERIGDQALTGSISAGLADTIEKIVTTRRNRRACQVSWAGGAPWMTFSPNRTMPDPLPLRSLHHVARRTKQLEASIAFYRDVLGFRQIPRPALGFPGAWLFDGVLQIHLLCDESIGAPAGPIQTRDDHLAFFSHDVAAVERLLTEHGVPFRVNVQSDTGLRQIFFRDPDGHHVEVATYPPTRET